MNEYSSERIVFFFFKTFISSNLKILGKSGIVTNLSDLLLRNCLFVSTTQSNDVNLINPLEPNADQRNISQIYKTIFIFLFTRSTRLFYFVLTSINIFNIVYSLFIHISLTSSIHVTMCIF